MTDELHKTLSEQEVPPVSQISTPQPPQPQKSNKNIWIIVGVALVVLCLCSITCIALFGSSIYKVYTEKAPVETVLNDYMRYMSVKDAQSAYALFSPRAQRQFPISKLQELLEGNNYLLFEGYQRLSVSNINISAVANINPDVPQGTVAKVTGVIEFEGGIQGSFDGTLEKVDGKWMIDGIYVTVPPNKIK
jgi:hypothetical protein